MNTFCPSPTFGCLIASDLTIQMFPTAFVSFILYSLIFLLPGFGWNFRLHRVNDAWVDDDDVDESQMSWPDAVASHLCLAGGPDELT